MSMASDSIMSPDKVNKLKQHNSYYLVEETEWNELAFQTMN